MYSQDVMSIIDRIKAGIEENGEYDLLLSDQTALVGEGVDIQALCLEKNWMLEHGAIYSVKISELPDEHEYNVVPEEEAEELGGEFVHTNHWT